MEEKREEALVCACCGCEVDDDDYYLVEDDIVCSSCYEDECGSCDRCGSNIYSENAVTDSDHFLCQSCYDDHYTRCYDCDRIVHNDDSYYADGYDLCFNCYEKHSSAIREYGYKPTPILYGQGKRFLGVELEVDNGGHDNDNAEELLKIANRDGEHIYIKSDGSLDDGFEIVTHPMSLDYHMSEFPWDSLQRNKSLCNTPEPSAVTEISNSTRGLLSRADSESLTKEEREIPLNDDRLSGERKCTSEPSKLAERKTLTV